MGFSNNPRSVWGQKNRRCEMDIGINKKGQNIIAKQGVRDLAMVRMMLTVVSLGLFVSGMTCYFLPWELTTIIDIVWGRGADAWTGFSEMHTFILKMEAAIYHVNEHYPEMFLGTDYLGFAHILLAILFIGPIINPVKNIWVVHFGMICCVLVIPAAFLFGYLRGAPTMHYFVDASFGIGAMLFLLIAMRKIMTMERSA
jgi:hypothetical protein